MIGFLRCRRFINPNVLEWCKWNCYASLTLYHRVSAYACRVEKEEENGGGPRIFDAFVYTQLLQDCISREDTRTGKGVHCHFLKNGWWDLFAWNTLLNLYVKLDLLLDACYLFDEMIEHNTVSFVTLIQGFALSEKFSPAVQLFLRLHREGHEFNAFVFTTVLKLLVTMDFPQLNQYIHACVYKMGYDSNAFVGAALIDTYSMGGHVHDARKVFDGLMERDVVSWTGMVGCYAENDCWLEALALFSEMREFGMRPNNYTFSALLRSCTGLELLQLGQSIHGCIIKSQLESDPYVAGGLLDMYAKCGGIEDSRAVFEAIAHRNVILWSFMISLYAQSDKNEEALTLFHRMRHAFVVPNDYTFSSILQAIASMKHLSWGKQAHGHVVKIGFDSDLYVANALIDVYAKCERMEESMQLFVELDHKNEVTWNTIIVGYVQLGYEEEAIRVFCQMLEAPVPASQVTYSGLLRASASSSVLELGIQIHSLVSKTVFCDDIAVCNALIDMYAKCGVIRDARKVFDTMLELDTISWNAIISGYALHGLGKDALNLYKSMGEMGMKPNTVTFVGVLSACSNTGLVDEGRSFFDSMVNCYGIQPSTEHYTCMVRLLGRSGQLDEAMKFLEKIPGEPSVMAWRAMLAACVVHKNIEFGKIVGERVLELDPEDGTSLVLMSNMYAAAGRWDDVALVRKSMRRQGLKKEPGVSWIEVQGEIHCFTVDDKKHSEIRAIYGMLEWLSIRTKQAGYIPDKKVVLHDLEETQKERCLWLHSERLALAFGLLKAPAGIPIRIIKNLRACSDCHEAFRVISKVIEREIVVRDLNRFHHFVNGFCSCGGYW